VAFISGGNYLSSVELYSPNGLCSFSIAPMPSTKVRHGMALRNQEIIACGGTGTPSCYIYFITNNTWDNLNTFGASVLPYTVYNNKFFFSGDGTTPLALDLGDNSWSTWPKATKNNYGSCQVAWKDAFIRFGGGDYDNWVLKFNHTTQNWTTLAINGPSFYFSGCALLPGDKVFIAGYLGNYNVFDLIFNKWIHNGTLSAGLKDMGVVTLGSRVFVLQGTQTTPQTNIVQEFHNSDYSVTSVSYLMQAIRDGMAAISVPAKLFRDRFPTCTGVS